MTPWTYIRATAPYTRLMPKVMKSDSACVRAPLAMIRMLLSSPHAQADREADQDRGTLPNLVDQGDRHDGHQGDDAADGEVEEPGHDDEGHPEGGEDQHPELPDDVVEIVEPVRNFGSTTDVTITSRAIAR